MCVCNRIVCCDPYLLIGENSLPMKRLPNITDTCFSLLFCFPCSCLAPPLFLFSFPTSLNSVHSPVRIHPPQCIPLFFFFFPLPLSITNIHFFLEPKLPITQLMKHVCIYASFPFATVAYIRKHVQEICALCVYMNVCVCERERDVCVCEKGDNRAKKCVRDEM